MTLYDSIDPNAIPAGAMLMAGYVDGAWPSYQRMVRLHPHATVVSITVKGSNLAQVCDIESGDLTPQRGAIWAYRMVALGKRPCLYYARSNVGAVAQALQQADVPITAVDYWVADWTGTPHLVPGSVATQYAANVAGCDLSVTNGAWPQALAPDPPAVKETDMLIRNTTDNKVYVWTPGSRPCYVSSPQLEAQYIALLGDPKPVSNELVVDMQNPTY